LLAFITGLPFSTLEKIIRKNLMREIYHVALEIQNLNSSPFVETLGLKFKEESALSGEKLLKLLVVIRDRMNMGDAEDLITKQNREIAPEGIDSSNVDQFIDHHRESFFSVIATKLEMNSSPSNKEIADLEERWNGLDPVLTLLSRYSRESGWHKLLPTLGKAFENSLKHTFQSFKFSGDPNNLEDQAQARKQISMFKSSKALREWTRNRVQVKAFEGMPIDPNILDLKHEISEIVKSNIIGEIEMTSSYIDFSDKKKIYALLEKREGTRKIIDDFIESHSTAEKPARLSFEQLLFAFHQYGPEDIKSMRKLLALLRIAKEQVNSEYSETELANIESNFNDIETRITSWTRVGNSKTVEGLIITTMNSDPKFLLTIGDLVETQSCQNYRTGSHIHALMGYVMDANVQGLASFFVGPQHFDSPAHYERVSLAAKGNRLQTSFDGNKLAVIFKITGSDDGIAVDLSKALYRSMIKLGTTADGSPGLKMERAYTPSYKADYLESGLHTALADNAKELFETLKADVGATSSGPITVIGSRSPGGMYSDLAHGVETNDYTIR
jgi:hypothetical protein